MAMKILHLYPSNMHHHIRTLAPGYIELLPEYEHIAYGVAAASHGGTVQSNLDAALLSGIGDWRSALRTSLSGDYEAIIVHSSFWPKAWIVLSILAFIKRNIIFVSWGGDLSPEARPRRRMWTHLLRRLFLRRCKRVVFLMQSDMKNAFQRYGKMNAVVIPYYNPRYQRFLACVRHSIRTRRVSIQIGNDASPVNGHCVCLKMLGAVPGLDCRIVLPMGYGRFSEAYIEEAVKEARALNGAHVDAIHELISAAAFDDLIDNCDAFMVASKEQRALYNVYSYLASGKMVFLPRDCQLAEDLIGAGFAIEALESIPRMGPDEFNELLLAGRPQNVAVAARVLGLEGIRLAWLGVVGMPRVTTACSGSNCVVV